MLETLYNLAASPIGKGIASALISYSSHYVITKGYSAVCVPDGFYGYIQGLISIGSPVCQAGVQAISATQVSYSSLIMMGVSRLFIDFIAPK